MSRFDINQQGQNRPLGQPVPPPKSMAADNVYDMPGVTGADLAALEIDIAVTSDNANDATASITELGPSFSITCRSDWVMKSPVVPFAGRHGQRYW